MTIYDNINSPLAKATQSGTAFATRHIVAITTNKPSIISIIFGCHCCLSIRFIKLRTARRAPYQPEVAGDTKDTRPKEFGCEIATKWMIEEVRPPRSVKSE